MKKSRAVIIGDSTNNTLSIIRSLGEAHIDQILILKCEHDHCFVSHSKYLKDKKLFFIKHIEECLPILNGLKSEDICQYIICSFDEAAMFIDQKEECLFPFFQTPARGHRIGKLFNKNEQCILAEECGLTVPKSFLLHRSDEMASLPLPFPILLKPLYSTEGEKSDIHICHNLEDISKAMKRDSRCNEFLLQEFVEKDYELDCIGVRTDKETCIAGAVKKIRHYPELVGAGAYGLFLPYSKLDINMKGIEMFLEKANYYGPFSVEFLHHGNDNYFMEVNFRNEGLAYAATVANANLHALYVNPDYVLRKDKIRKVYMMNYSIDFLYVKEGKLKLVSWIRDFLRTSCFININKRDLGPTLAYYKHKFASKLHR